MTEPVPQDIVRLSKMTPRFRKLLWIVGVPAFFVQGFIAEKQPIVALVGAILSVAVCVLAATRRPPLRDPGIRQLVEHPEQVDEIAIVDNPAMPQIVFLRGGEGLAFLDIEDSSKFGEALDIVSVHLPGVPVNHIERTLSRFEYTSFFSMFVRRF